MKSEPGRTSVSPGSLVFTWSGWSLSLPLVVVEALQVVLVKSLGSHGIRAFRLEKLLEPNGVE